MTQPGTIAYPRRTIAKAVFGVDNAGQLVASSQFGLVSYTAAASSVSIVADVSGVAAPNVFLTIAQIQPEVFLLSSANAPAQFVQCNVGPLPGEFVLQFFHHNGQPANWNAGTFNGLWFALDIIEGPIQPADLP